MHMNPIHGPIVIDRCVRKSCLSKHALTYSALTYESYDHDLQAPCNDIIQRANSIMEYDMREGKQGHAAAICPVLRELYKAPETHSVAWIKSHVQCIDWDCILDASTGPQRIN